MSPTRLARLREELLAEQSRLQSELDRLESLVPVRPPDVVDQAELAMEASSVEDRRRRASARLEEVEAALDRLADGSLGQCRVCGDAIDAERLELLPTTTVCRRDAGLRVAG